MQFSYERLYGAVGASPESPKGRGRALRGFVVGFGSAPTNDDHGERDRHTVALRCGKRP